MLFRGWVVDDAGISFAYARNLAEGHGLVSQPGVAPVEGYSNFSWVMLLSPFFLLRFFDPGVTPKLISFILVLLSFVVLRRTFRLMTKNYILITAGVLLMLAINTAFVVWTTSGLENPLLVLFLCLYFYWMVRYHDDRSQRQYLYLLGAITALVAMTRPDGLLYLVVLPAYLLMGIIFWRYQFKRAAIDIMIYAATFACFFGSFLLFRVLYFGELLPNTYYAKGGTFFSAPNAAPLLTQLVKRSWELFNGVAPVTGVLIILALLAATAYLAVKNLLRGSHLVLSLLLMCSFAVFLILPADWMGEYRFATAFFVFLYSYIFIIGEVVLIRVRWKGSIKAVLAVTLAVLFAGSSAVSFAQRSHRFAEHPTISFGDVADKYAFMFNTNAERLDIKNGSIILPDLGGMLYYSQLRVYDLAGLCDKTIARTLSWDQKAFYDYVFETLRPSLIFSHSEYTELTKFDLDSRFRRDYIPVVQYREPAIGPELFSGVFIRKELAQGKQDVLGDFSDDVTAALNS